MAKYTLKILRCSHCGVKLKPSHLKIKVTTSIQIPEFAEVLFIASALEFLGLRWENTSGILEQSICDYIFSQMTSVFKDHSFSMYAKFSRKLTFLTPDTQTSVCLSEGKKC